MRQQHRVAALVIGILWGMLGWVEGGLAQRPAITGATVPCVDGHAAGYDCHNIELLAYLPAAAIGGTDSVTIGDSEQSLVVKINDMWGWTDATTQREFALVGLVDGTAFVEVTDPIHPRYLGKLPQPDSARPSAWRDVKVYHDHAFIVADNAGPHGMQVFDLRQLLHVEDTPKTFVATAFYDSIKSVHNIVIDTATGFAYAVGVFGGGGAASCNGGMHIVDIRQPAAPAFVGCYPETLGGSRKWGYVHDAQCIVYHGPDRRYRGREICVNAALKGIGIVDLTDKSHPKALGVGAYPNIHIAHQGWFTEDQHYFFLGDESDEGEGRMTRTLIFDLTDLEDPVLVKEFFGTTQASDHNLYIRGSYVYEANYKAGLRILDGRNPVNPREVAYFDSTPDAANDAAFAGAWSNYPFFRNGVVGLSSIGEGLFLVRFPPPAVP